MFQKDKLFTNRIEPGFRLNLGDIFFIIFMLLISFVINVLGFPISISYLPLFITLSFFLFCNVFRIGTTLELIWIILTLPYVLWEITHDVHVISLYLPPCILIIIVTLCAMWLGWYRGYQYEKIAYYFKKSIKNIKTNKNSLYRDLSWIKFIINNGRFPPLNL